MLISEIYKSIQGEGLLTGTESIFVRTSGCNLRCGFCDTPYTSWTTEGENQQIPEIVQEALELDCQHLVLTGGEPMLQKEVVDLTVLMRKAGFHITIETAGTIDQPVECDLMSISPKLSNSNPDPTRAGAWHGRHASRRHRPDAIRSLVGRYPYQLKFVVDHPNDGQEILEYLGEFPEVKPERVLLMPQGVSQADLAEKEPWIEAFGDQHGFRLCRRMHIVWFGNQRGT